MSSFEKFEDILAWQKARAFTKRIYQITAGGAFSKDFALRDQIRRASISVMANIAEGFGRRTNKDFANFLVIAHGSAAETQSHLYLAVDLGYLAEAEFNAVYQMVDEASRMVMSLCQHLRRTS